MPDLCAITFKQSKNLAQRFRDKKDDNFSPIKPFFGVDAQHRRKKMVQKGQKLAFFGRNVSGVSFY